MYLKRLKELREDYNKSQTQIANLLKITQQQYSLYEKGIRTIPIDLIVQLCKIYNVTSDYILEIEKNNNVKILHKMLILRNNKYIIVNK